MRQQCLCIIALLKDDLFVFGAREREREREREWERMRDRESARLRN